MNKKLLFALLFFSLFIVISCKSTPEPEEEDLVEEAVPEEVVEEPVVESGSGSAPVEEPVVEEPAVQSVSEEELALARQALERAEIVDGSRFAPSLMREAYAEMRQAQSLAESDPEAARELLASVVEKSNAAFEAGRQGLKDEAYASLDKWEANLKSIDADKFSPEAYSEVMEQFAVTRAAIEAEELTKARNELYTSRMKSTNLYNILNENIRWVRILERDTNNYLADAEAQEAYLWADEEFNRASYLLSDGMLKFRQYNLSESETVLKEAKFRARNTLYLVQERKKQAATDARLMQVQMELEEASTLTVQEEDGSIVEASPWSGADYLNANPLLDAKGEDYVAEESELESYDLDAPIEEEEEEEVAGPMVVSRLLEQAKELWQMAIDERNAGNYERSAELLSQAEAYIRTYKANAVGKTYVVKYREVETDCLWRIAEFDEIYADPFLWPKIWQRNQKDIPNPDLIYPGQVLIIPPVE